MNHNLLFVMLSFLFSSLLAANALEIGSPAPEVSTIDHNGDVVDLGSALNKSTAVVFFYPKAMTPGCTKQACSLRDAWDILQERAVDVFGVSSDSAKTQAAFRDKHQLPFTLIADKDNAVSKAFGRGKWSRQAYIFKGGKLVWKDLKASTGNQAQDVLVALDKLED